MDVRSEIEKEMSDYSEEWQVCVPKDQAEEDNVAALEEYLNNMNYT